MKRREFITLVGGGAAAWPLAARAQQRDIPVVGFLHGASPDTIAPWLAAFRRGLQEAGFVEGRNVAIEYRATDQNDRLPQLADDLVHRRVAVIVTGGGPNPPLAAKAATTTIPIVFVSASDPIDVGLVTSFNHPDANLTGIYVLGSLLNPKRAELLHELLPTAPLIAMLVNPSRASTPAEIAAVQAAADKIGLQIRILAARTDSEIDTAFAAIVQGHIGGLIVHGDPFFTSRRDQLVLLTTRHAIPTIFAWREFAEIGGLMSYGPSLKDGYRQGGIYTGRILKGSKPGDLPIMQSTTFELVINLKAAKVLGIDVPPMLLALADEVIE